MAQHLPDFDIAIVGAGAAGLAAARTACDAGLRTVVLEAKNRVGGRAFTEDRTLGVPFDHGCRWLHSASLNPFVPIARTLGYAPEDERRVRYLFLPHAGGVERWTREEAAEGWLTYYNENLRRIETAGDNGHDLPAAEIVDQQSPWFALLDARVAMSTSMNLDAISSLDHVRYIDSRENWVIPEGYGTMIAHFGAGLPVSLDAPVSRVSWGGPGVRLETPAGTVDAGAAILTVSTTVLGAGQIEFDPPLPDWKTDAIAAVPIGNANKIAFSVRRDIFGGTPGCFSILSSTGADAINFQVRPCGAPVVSGFVGGRFADALEEDGTDATRSFALERLKAIFGADFEKEVSGFCCTTWGSDPHIRGGYSAAKPGEAHRRADLAMSLADRLFFAGEATHLDFYSTAHGAYLSGVDAAQRAGALAQGSAA